jgi:hypothetical protein
MITEQISEVANRLKEAYIVWLARGGHRGVTLVLRS